MWGRPPARLALFLLALPCLAATYTFHVAGDNPSSWPQIPSFIGLTSAQPAARNLKNLRHPCLFSITKQCAAGPRLAWSLLLSALPSFAATDTFHVAGDNPGSWPQILCSIGFTSSSIP